MVSTSEMRVTQGKVLIFCVLEPICELMQWMLYRIARMFGVDKVWQIASSKVVGEKKFGKCLQQHCAAYYYEIITCRIHVRDCVCNHEVGTRMNSFVVDSVILGHHICKAIWEPVNGEELNTERETGDPHDPLAVAVTKLLQYENTSRFPTFSEA